MSDKYFLSDLEQLKKELWHIRKTLIPSLQTQINNSTGGNISELVTRLTAVEGRASTLEDQVSTLQGTVSTNSSSISTFSTSLSGLDTRVTTLESSGGSGSSTGETIDVIFDMRSEDPAINRGFTSGATGGKTFRLNFNIYTSIRVFATLNDFDTQQVIKVAERKKTDTSLFAINTNFSEIYYLKYIFPPAATVFQVGKYGIYTYDTANNNELTITSGSVNTNFFIYRIEGIV